MMQAIGFPGTLARAGRSASRCQFNAADGPVACVRQSPRREHSITVKNKRLGQFCTPVHNADNNRELYSWNSLIKVRYHRQ